MDKDYTLFTYEEKLKRIERELAGIEYDVDDEESYEEVPYNADKIRIESRVYSVYQVYKSIQDGSIDLMPSFQRNKIWSKQQKSLLIESLMLKITLPSFYFDEDHNGDKSVIDGLQRLSAISGYMNNEYKLEGLQYLSLECEGIYYRDLPKKYVKRIEEAQLNINILDERCPSQVKLDVFRRVNTGGIPLNDQEIRNVLANDKTRNLLLKMATSSEFIKATRNIVEDMRMDAQELCLRFIAFDSIYNDEFKTVKKHEKTSELLDNTILYILNAMDDAAYEKVYEKFIVSMKKCFAFLGNLAFSKPDGTHYINKPLFTSWSVLMAYCKYSVEELESKQESAMNEMRNIFKNKQYSNAISSNTSSQNSLNIQFYYAQKILEDIMNDKKTKVEKLQVL